MRGKPVMPQAYLDKTIKASPTNVDIRRLKAFALSLPREATLRDLLLTEEDQMNTDEFLAKMDIWLKILKTEPS